MPTKVLTERDLRQQIAQGCHHFPGFHFRGDVNINLGQILKELGIPKLERLCFAGAHFAGDLKITGGRIGNFCIAGATIEGCLDHKKTIVEIVENAGLKEGTAIVGKSAAASREGGRVARHVARA